MSELRFTLLDMFPEPYAASPTLSARLRIETAGPDPVHAIALRAQVRLEPQRRGYGEEEAAGLTDLFGPRERWASTLRPFLWMQCSTLVQGFTETTEVDLRRDLVAQSFPASGWLRLDHQTLAMLSAYKAARGLTTYDEAANDPLAHAGEVAR